MATTTSIAPLYGGQKIFAAVLLAGLGLWGVYDYTVTIPRQENTFVDYQAGKTHLAELQTRQDAALKQGRSLTQAEMDDYAATKKAVEVMAPGGAEPLPPSKFNRITQWFYITCLPFVPWFIWLYVKAKRQVYRLDDEGALHFTGNPALAIGTWAKDDIADIDMHRWMAKSIAWAVHKDGTRLKLDAYLHKNLHLIIGAISNRFYPDQWDAEGKMVKAEPAEEAAEAPEQS